jgi:hypothetical protein
LISLDNLSVSVPPDEWGKSEWDSLPSPRSSKCIAAPAIRFRCAARV